MKGISGFLLLAAGAVLAAGPQPAPTQSSFSTYRISQAPTELRRPIERADLVIVELQNAMLGELSREMDRGGAAVAIRSCHVDTTSAAYRAARDEGIKVGRTSDRLRAPTNRPQPWAAPLVAEYAGKRASDVEGFAVDLGDRVGVLRPIAERPMCAACHGDSDKLDPRVRQELADRYPKDLALNFRTGEIRGWFWVEVPKK
jgi:Protein of unknown function (DUF3365)